VPNPGSSSSSSKASIGALAAAQKSTPNIQVQTAHHKQQVQSVCCFIEHSAAAALICKEASQPLPQPHTLLVFESPSVQQQLQAKGKQLTQQKAAMKQLQQQVADRRAIIKGISLLALCAFTESY
jgi:hypothetical protein